MGKMPEPRRPAGDAAVVVEFVVGIQVLELEAVDDAAAVPEQQVREDEDEHPVRLLAPAELDDRVPAGGRAVDCSRRRRRRDLMGYRRPQTRPPQFSRREPRDPGEPAFAARRPPRARGHDRAPRRRRAPRICGAPGASSSGRAPPAAMRSAMAIGDAGTLRRDLLLLQVRDGPAEHALAGSRRFRHGPLFRCHQGSLVAVIVTRESAGLPPIAASARRGDVLSAKPGAAPRGFAAGPRLLVSYGR